jgi:TolB-like protein/Tfp pilus assembly protein PilF
MLTGERPFSGATPQAIMAKRFTEMPRALRTVMNTIPESVEKAVSKAMAIDASGRYGTAAQFGQALASGSLITPTDTASLPQANVSAAKSVAVLPFVNLSADPENEYFTDGMADEIISALTKIQSLRVTSRTSSFVFKGKSEDLGEIGRKLKVSTVLEGSVRKIGNKLRVTAQLVNVADGSNLWSERYDREIEDIFAIQDDISQAIVKALRVILTEGEKKQIVKSRTENVQAYDYYLRGRQYSHQLRRKSLEYARQMFNKAIEIDPDYARAYAGVADACSMLYTYFDAREFNLRQADTASQKALALEPELAEAHVARGLAVSLRKQFDEAEREFETAMKLDPKLFEAAYFYGRALQSAGRFQEAVKMFERASTLRPEDYQAPGFLAQAYGSLGFVEQRDAGLRRALKLMEDRLELNPDDARAANLAAAFLARLGDLQKSVEYADRSLAIDPEDPMLLYNVSCTYVALGRFDDAMKCLERAVDKGFGHKEWIDHDPDLDPLRDNARFKVLSDAM